MKKRISIYIVFLFSIACAQAETAGLYLKEKVFQGGETAKFNIYFNWGFIWIHAGDVDFSVQTEEDQNGEPVYSLKVAGNTTKTFDKMYRIRDTFEAVVDTMSLLPIYYREVKHEDSYYAHKEYFYDRRQDSTEVFLNFQRKERKWKDTIRIDNQTFDLITTCYNVRNLNIKNLDKNQSVPFPMLFDDDVYDLALTYKGKETIKLRNGNKYNALKFTPKLITGDLFKKEEDMVIYVSDDDNHVPLLIEAKIKVGYIKAMLAEIENTKMPMSSLVKKK